MRQINRNPLGHIAVRQRLTADFIDAATFPLLAYLDAVKRSASTIAAENALVKLVLVVQLIGGQTKNRLLYNIACEAGESLFFAINRSNETGNPLGLTTGEYAAVRRMMRAYLRVLPQLDMVMFVGVQAEADKVIADMIEKGEAAQCG